MAYKVVIVEDDEILTDIYKVRLELAGYIAVTANNGINGLNTIRQELPDLVLLDLMLPQMSGDEVLAAMRANDWGKDIKVLMLTNISESEAPDNIRDFGIEGYIVKANLSKNQLAETVAEVMAGTFVETK